MKQRSRIRICILILTMLMAFMHSTAYANIFLNPKDLRAKVGNCQSWVSLRENPSTTSRRLCKVICSL